jgi:hypothetical protein
MNTGNNMIQIEDTIIRNLIYHRVNPDKENSLLSETLYDFTDDDEEVVLKKIFLKPFLSNTTTYEFKHEIDLELNPLYKLSHSIHEGNDFIAQSKNICQHLKTVSKHPNIKDGDLFIMSFDNIIFENRSYEGLGIYKIENKENFIETIKYFSGEAGLKFRKGIGSKRLDKACLILFTETPYTVFIIDNTSNETDYWQNEFIKVNLRDDNANNTNQFLSLAKSFVTKQLPSEFETTKADQIDLLNRSVEYFRKNESFDRQNFEQEVFQESEVIKSFQTFDSKYRQENEIQIADDFLISSQAVKKQARVFKSVLKLDKNFHIYIHGNNELIQQGVDSDGRKYYKIYFETES